MGQRSSGPEAGTVGLKPALLGAQGTKCGQRPSHTHSHFSEHQGPLEIFSNPRDSDLMSLGGEFRVCVSKGYLYQSEHKQNNGKTHIR